MRRWLSGAVVALITFLALTTASAWTIRALPSPQSDGLASAWVVQTVEDAEGMGKYTSLALDTAGRPHISYYYDSYPDHYLKYAYHDGSIWHFDIADFTGGMFTSLVLDVAGQPHIGYCRELLAGYCNVKYTYHDGAGWRTEDVAYEGAWISLVLDQAEMPRMSYLNTSYPDSLSYAYRNGADWQVETVDSNIGGFMYSGGYPSLALDADDLSHISYYDSNASDLKHAYFDGLYWHIETVVSAGDQGMYTSLALDGNGHPHISFYDNGPNYDLRYAYNDGSQWHIETVDSVGNVGLHTSLTLDAADHPHIAYFDWTNGVLKYAHYVGGIGNCGPSNTWSCETVDSGLGNGGFTSLELDAGDRPHISYYDADHEDLKYAYVCTAVSEVKVEGPLSVLVGQEATYHADPIPLYAGIPITFTWSNSTISPTATFSWATPGTHTLVVTATNPCGQAQGNMQVLVLTEWPYELYLPLIVRNDQ